MAFGGISYNLIVKVVLLVVLLFGFASYEDSVVNQDSYLRPLIIFPTIFVVVVVASIMFFEISVL